MEWIAVALVAAFMFGICFGADKLFTRLFRSRAQHRSGKSVRLNRKYGAFGAIIMVLGLAAVFAGAGSSGWLLAGGCFMILVGLALVVYYMTFGVYYDEDGFLLTTFGRKSKLYHYSDITGQMLYNSYGSILIELHLQDGRTVQLQAGMFGVYPFLDYAFSCWCTQKGIDPRTCSFHDPANSCWFPGKETD